VPARRRALPVALLLVAATLAFLAIFAVWAKRQALDTDHWTRTSSELLEQPAIRAEVSTFLVGRLYANVDVASQTRAALPPRARRLAGPAASGLRDLAERATSEVLAQPRAQRLWEEANRRAHRQLVHVLEGRSNGFVRDEGLVTLDLRELLAEIADRLGVGGRAVAKLPDDAAQITILRPDQLDFAQDVVRVFKALVVVLLALSLGLAAWAVAVARGWRREALRGVGLGLISAGAAALVVRHLAGNEVVDALATTERVRPAAEAAWTVGTSSLEQAAVATITYGVVVLVAAWLAGPTRPAVAVRAALAPYLREARLAYGALAGIVVLVLVWGPTPATRAVVPALLLIALLTLGLELLRRQTAREFQPVSRGEDPRGATARLEESELQAENGHVLDAECQVPADRGAAR
jgi:hypothetical protein